MAGYTEPFWETHVFEDILSHHISQLSSKFNTGRATAANNE